MLSPLVSGALAQSLTQPIYALYSIGAGAVLLSMIRIVVAVNTSSATLFVLAALLVGVGLGLGQLGGLTLISMHVPTHQRAEANGVFNAGGYVPAGLLPVAAGYLIDHSALASGTLAFACVIAATAIAAGFFVRGKLKRD